MVTIEDSIVLDEILEHVGEQRARAKLVDHSFELGIVTDKRPSQILDLIHNNEAVFKEIGMTKFEWYDDALRSKMRVAGEELLFSISRKR
ncbi:MAG: hypothetical protein ABIQ64_00320 [Candidatus Saccharimonadales bacterium]